MIVRKRRLRTIVTRTLVVTLGFPSAAFAQVAVPLPATAEKPDEHPAYINPDRPGIADGSAVIGKRRFQIEAGFEQDYRKDNGTSEHKFFVPMLFRFGIDKHWEARIEGNSLTGTRTSDPMTGVRRTTGLSPFSYGFKYHFQDADAKGKPSLATIFRLFPASGSSDFRTNHTTGDVRLAADWQFTKVLSLNPNIGAAIYEDSSGRAFTAGLFALTLNYNPTERLNPFIDMGFQGPEERNGKSSLIYDLGVAYFTSPNVQLDISFGTGVLGRTTPHPFWSAGISVGF